MWSLQVAHIMSDNGANFISAISNLEDLGTKDYGSLIKMLEDEKYGENIPSPSSFLPEDNEITEDDIIKIQVHHCHKLILDAFNEGHPDIDIKTISGGLNGCKWNTCGAHSFQVLLRNVFTICVLFEIIKNRINDIVAFVINRAEVRRKLKLKCGKTLLVPCPTRWSYHVYAAERLLEVIYFGLS